MPTDIVHAPGLLESGGPIILVQLALALLAAVLVVERLFYFHRARINEGDFLLGLSSQVRRKAFAEALHESSRAPGPVARVAHAVLLRHGMERCDLRDIAQESGQLEVPRIESNLRGILAVALVAPLTGMLGTVLGLVEVFQALGAGDRVGLSMELSNGVFQALGTTAFGLVVAIPSYLFYWYFLGRARRLMHRLERVGIEMVNIICDARSETELIPLREGREQRRPS